MSLFILDVLLVLLIPGIIWSNLIVTTRRGDTLATSLVERMVLSFGLALVIVPLSAFILNPFFDIGSNDMPVVVLFISLLGIVANLIVYKEEAQRAMNGLLGRE